jgi:hypothetical protein
MHAHLRGTESPRWGTLQPSLHWRPRGEPFAGADFLSFIVSSTFVLYVPLRSQTIHARKRGVLFLSHRNPVHRGRARSLRANAPHQFRLALSHALRALNCQFGAAWVGCGEAARASRGTAPATTGLAAPDLRGPASAGSRTFRSSACPGCDARAPHSALQPIRLAAHDGRAAPDCQTRLERFASRSSGGCLVPPRASAQDHSTERQETQ